MAEPPSLTQDGADGSWGVRAVLLTLWAVASFGVAFFARELDQVVAGWPVNYWLAAQGSVLVFMGIVGCFAWWADRADAAASGAPAIEDDRLD